MLDEKHQPPFHVVLNVQKVFEANAPRFSGCCFQHEPTEFWVEDWQYIAMTVMGQNAVLTKSKGLITVQRIVDLVRILLVCTMLRLSLVHPGCLPAVRIA